MRSCKHLDQPQAGGPPLVGSPRLLLQYIRATLHIRGRSSIRNLKTRHAVVTMDNTVHTLSRKLKTESWIDYGGRESSVGIVASYGVSDVGVLFPVGTIFLAQNVQTGPGAHPAHRSMGAGSFSGVETVRALQRPLTST